jgi:hypothetical protein
MTCSSLTGDSVMPLKMEMRGKTSEVTLDYAAALKIIKIKWILSYYIVECCARPGFKTLSSKLRRTLKPPVAANAVRVVCDIGGIAFASYSSIALAQIKALFLNILTT